jgi:ketosteroid isomerase-like protein
MMIRETTKETEKMKSTNDVLDHHLKASEQGDVDAVLSDYALDAVLFRKDGVFKGVAAIRPVFERFVAEFQTPGNSNQNEGTVGRRRLWLYGVDGRDPRQHL